MRNRIAGATAMMVASSLAWMTPPALAESDSLPESPGWYAQELENFADSTGRLQDQLSNPEYWPLRLSQQDPTNADPYRALDRWAPARGRVKAVSYPNRYGAMISAHLWAPSQTDGGPYPAVIFINGAGVVEEAYWSFAQDLAEHGYVVMTFDPQGAGKSDAAPNPESKYCDPNGSWRNPQEMGVREHGECAGQNDNGVDSTVGQVPGVVDIAVGGRTGQQGRANLQDLYDQLSPNFIFGAIDAYEWMDSPANRWRDEINFARVAVMGHSLGAYAAAMLANGDPLRRFRVGVSLDSYAHLMHDVQPRVPTLYQQSEQEIISGPRLAAPPPTALHATRQDYETFVARRVDTMYVVLRASNHSEFAYSGPAEGVPASRAGQRVATYFALAWLDRHLEGANGARHRDANARLVASHFDRSVDQSSIGQGRWDPATMTNQPYLIAGQRVAAALSSLYVSQYDFGPHRCDDMRRGCRWRGPRP